jgi:hypothetical protein
VFIDNDCHIVNKTSNHVVAKALRNKEKRLYRFQLFTPQVIVKVIEASNTITLLHKRL